jgi:hypothetical protein
MSSGDTSSGPSRIVRDEMSSGDTSSAPSRIVRDEMSGPTGEFRHGRFVTHPDRGTHPSFVTDDSRRSRRGEEPPGRAGRLGIRGR